MTFSESTPLLLARCSHLVSPAQCPRVKPEAASLFGDIGTWAVALATLGLLVAAVVAGKTASAQVQAAARGVKDQIDAQRQLDRQRRVYEHLSRYYSPDFTQNSADAYALFRVFRTSPAKGRRKWKRMSDHDRGRILAVLNFTELLASEYNAEFLDRRLADHHLAYLALYLWEAAEPFIEWQQQTDPALFSELKELHDRYGPQILETIRGA